MPYAFKGGVSMDEVANSVEISVSEYAAAIEAMAEGKVVSIDEGLSFIDPPEPETPPLPPTGDLVEVVYAVHLWERMSNEEADQVEAIMQDQPVRMRNIFRAANSYRSDHELWSLLNQIATTLFGEDRAAQILEPSELVPAG